MRHLMIALLAMASLLAATVSTAQQEPARLALLIGNKGYTAKVGPLRNPHTDVDLIDASLRKLGFKVTVLKDASYKSMDSALKRYVADVRRAGPNTLSFVYYSGHGAANPETQINYLIPVDVTDADDDKVWFESFQHNTIIDMLTRQAANAVHYVVLDACRNELNLTKAGAKALGTDKGFVPINYTTGVLIAYATAPGKTAADGSPGGGPYAKALADELVKPGVEAYSMFRNVGLRVKRETGQDPWLSSSTLPAMYLAGQVAQPAAPPPLPSTTSAAAREWQDVKDTTSLSVLERYIQRHTSDPVYTALAQDRIDYLKRQQQVALATAEAERQRREAEQREKAVADAAARKKAEDDARTKADTERQRLAMLQQEEARKRAEAAAANTLKPGSVFRDCNDGCPEMVVVPAGEFIMGSNDFDNEKPIHKVTIRQPFAVGKFEVTFAEWDACVAGGGCKHKPDDEKWGRSRQPVINVSWDHITKEYLPWLTKKSGKTYRLLTEAEWEFAARGGTNASAPHPKYWWGNEASHEYANYGADTCCSGLAQGRDKWVNTAPVGQFPENPFGLHDMHGNAWEWVQDCFQDNYNGAPYDGRAVADTASCLRVLRGGSWFNSPDFLRSASRYRIYPVNRYDSIGFRVARTLSPP